MLWLRDLSFRKRIVLYSILSTGTALCLAAVAVVVVHSVKLKGEIVHNLTTQADIIAVNSTAALSFEDADAAQETLFGLQAEPNVIYACIYTEDGKLFASYKRAGAPEPLPVWLQRLEGTGHRVEGDALILSRPIVHEGERLGTIQVRYELASLYSHVKQEIAIVALVMLGSLVAAFLLSTKLQGTLTKPIIELVKTAKVVSETRDYSARARKYRHDELGALTDAFNEMLAQIEQRDHALGQARNELEMRVQERTADLTEANESLQAEIAERTRAEAELEKLHKELVQASRQAGMSEVATGVLHNVGNVLNSVNVSASIAAEKIRQSKAPSLAKATALMDEHAEDLGTFITADEQGRQLPGYLTKLAAHLAREQTDVLEELGSLTQHIEHIKNIVSMQQSYASVSGMVEGVSVADLVEDALGINMAAFERHQVRLVREYGEIPPVALERHKLLQILVNLFSNSKYALSRLGGPDRRLTVRINRVGQAACLPVSDGPIDPTALADKPPVAPERINRVAPEGDRVRIEVADNGVGIPAENLTRIFSYGFTTKKDGRGFGLHSSALAAKEMGGSLTAHSDGSDKGATFTLELPIKSAGVAP